MSDDTIHESPLMLSVSGCRGVVGQSLTPERIVRFAGAFAAWLYETRRGAGDDPITIIIGRDGRCGGEIVQRLATGALAMAGCRVVDLGVAMTPSVGIMVEQHEADGGLVITASHNGQEWNGIKCLTAQGSAPSQAQADRIIELFREGKTPTANHAHLGALRADDTAAHAHVARVLNAIEGVTPVEKIKARRFRVAVDSVNASGSGGARLLLSALGCEVVHLNCEETGVFPHRPEPVREHLTELANATRAQKCDAGFAQDPDADRLAIIDEHGEYIGEEYTLALAAMALLSSGAGGDGATLATNLSTSRMVDDVAAGSGARVLRTAVGEANVVDRMRADGCALGGEGNGGVIWPAVGWIRDSLSAMALVLALLTREGNSVSGLVSQTPRYTIVKRKVPIQAGLAAKLASEMRVRFAGERVDEQDGVRVDFADGAWVHVRASNTEPILRLIAEAEDESRANGILDELELLVGVLSGKDG